VDILEKLYLAGFPILLAVTSAFPLLSHRFNYSAADMTVTSDVAQCIPIEGFPYSNMTGVVGTGVPNNSSTSAPMEFLPLMLISIYCSIGLIWGYLRLGFIYLNEDTLYRRSTSE
jgi:alpha-1,3-glucosyltransferase